LAIKEIKKAMSQW